MEVTYSTFSRKGWKVSKRLALPWGEISSEIGETIFFTVLQTDRGVRIVLQRRALQSQARSQR